MPEFMGNAEACGSRPALVIDQNLALAAHPVGQQHAFAAVESLAADLFDTDRKGDLVDRHRAVEATDLPMQSLRQRLRGMNICQIDAIELQRRYSTFWGRARIDFTISSMMPRSRDVRSFRSR